MSERTPTVRLSEKLGLPQTPEARRKRAKTLGFLGGLAASTVLMFTLEHGSSVADRAEAAIEQPALTYSDEMQTYAQPEALAGTAVDAETAVYNAAQEIDGAEDVGINEVMGDVKEWNATILEDGVVTDGEIFQIPESVTRE